MLIADGYTDLPPGKIANVVTCLEMLARPCPQPDPPDADCTLERATESGVQWYRELFARVGGPYLWGSRLVMDDRELAAVIGDPRVEVYAVRRDGQDAGLLELDFRVPRECEITFIGLVADSVGKGIGRWLMNRALDLAWAHPIDRLWVHTCTLDHPKAVRYYIDSGFVPFKRQIEILDDPRVTGVLPRSCAPDVPIL